MTARSVTPSLTTPALVVCLALSACADDTAPPIIGEPDAPSVAGVAIEEGAITATLGEDAIEVSVPFVRTREDGTAGTIEVSLTRLDGTVVARASRPFDLASSPRTEVALTLAAHVAPGLAEVDHLVRYRIQIGDARASGQRSLFTIVPKIDLRARLPWTQDADTPARLRVSALDPTTLAPRPGTPLVLALTDGADTIEARALAGEDGSALFDLPARPAGVYQIEARAESDGGTIAALHGGVQVTRRARVLVTTDKPVYQPGQTMHIRALSLLRPSLRANARAAAQVEVFDGKGNRVADVPLVTSDFGVAATDFALAHEVNVGTYRIAVTVDGETTEKRVEVRPYTLPKFAIAVALERPYVLTGEALGGTISARYFFGKAVRGAVSVRAVSQDGVTLGSASGELDDEGLHAFSLRLDRYTGALTLEVLVTDTAGQVEGKLAPALVAPAHVVVTAWPEGGQLERGVDNAIWIEAHDPLGQPVDADLTLVVDGTAVPVEVLAPGLGRALFTPSSTDAYFIASLRVSAITPAGERASAELAFSSSANTAGLVVRAERPLVRAGETLVLDVVAARGDFAYIDLLEDGQTLAATSVALDDQGRGRAEIALDPTLTGDLVAAASVLLPDGTRAESQTLVFVRDARGLSVDIRPDRDTYAPGEGARIDLSVKDASGRPAVAALGVTIVDEAVFALADQQPGRAESFFMAGDALTTATESEAGARLDLSAIISGPSDEVAQHRAAAAFAALDTAALGGELSSWSEVSWQLYPIVDAACRADATRIEAWLRERALAGGLDLARADELRGFFDPWGQPYTLDGSEGWGGYYYVAITSRGPDELAGTFDDWSGAFQIDTRRDDDGPYPSGNYQDASVADTSAPDTTGPWPTADAGTSDSGPSAPSEGEESGPRVRKDFPETLFAAPAIITDEQGRASLELGVADQITTFRISALANTQAGALGSAAAPLTVFQDFFIDVTFPSLVTQGDRFAFPVTVYNYLPSEQTVTLVLDDADWLVREGDASQVVTLAPGEVKAVRFPVSVETPGVHALTVRAQSQGAADAVQRVTTVRPDGVREAGRASGTLDMPVAKKASYPSGTIAGTEELALTVFPGLASQVVEGLEGLLQVPNGCFEQTTATNWPNTLVLDYLQGSGQDNPTVTARATDLLQKGYQHLLTFECSGGGFTWFGDPEAGNVILSAMGVLEFSDMSRVIAVDARVIERTAAWLAARQDNGGSWTTDRGSEFATVAYDDLKTTAFVTWALASAGQEPQAVQRALAWLASRVGESTDTYTVALAANAFASAEPDSARTRVMLERLVERAEAGDDATVSWSTQAPPQYYGWDMGGDLDPVSLEVTALAVQALSAAQHRLDLAMGAIPYLASQKDALGNWGTTHATILTLRAFIAALGSRADAGEGTVTVTIDGATVATVTVGGEAPGAFHTVDLGAHADAAGTDVQLSYSGTGRVFYELGWAAWVPSALATPPAVPSLALDVRYEGAEVAAGELIPVTATATNLTAEALDMVMIEIGIPPGASVIPDALVQAVAERRAMKYELGPESIRLYLGGLAPNASATFEGALLTGYPVEAKIPDSRAWLYYDPAQRAVATGGTLRVR